MPSKNTKKKIKQSAKSTQHNTEAKVEDVVLAENAELTETNATTEVPAQVEAKLEEQTETKAEANEEVKSNKNKKIKEKKPSKLKKKAKEVTSELKKVTWPTVGQVAKKTAVVIAVVVLFAIALFGIDTLLELLYKLFISNLHA